MELKDTVLLMNSPDWKDRLRAEYFQLQIRISSMEGFLQSWEKGELKYSLKSPISFYRIQLSAMYAYLNALEDRMKMEGVPR